MNVKITSEEYYNALQKSRYATEKAFTSSFFRTN